MKTRNLEMIGACAPGKKWFAQRKNLREAWEKCERGDWMVWFLSYTGFNRYEFAHIAEMNTEVWNLFDDMYYYKDDKRPTGSDHKRLKAARKELADEIRRCYTFERVKRAYEEIPTQWGF